jgi:hypothetical protein
MPTITIQVNPPNEPVILGPDEKAPASVTPRTIVATFPLHSLLFSRAEIVKAADAISGVIPNAPIVAVMEALRAIFPDSTFEPASR